MITDEMLREAAAKTSAAYLRYVEQGYDPENQHVFSPEFEKKMEKLIRKAKHIFLYQTLRRIASVVLAVLISASAWLAIDVNARAAFFGWAKETYETYFVYHHDQGANVNVDPVEYRPTWLPEGYSEFAVNDTGARVMVAYVNDDEKILRVNYILQNSDGTDWFVDVSQAEIKDVLVNGNQAEVFIAEAKDSANAIAWTTNDAAFYVTGFLSEAELVAVAESIQEIS